jgi:hypothetical protein
LPYPASAVNALFHFFLWPVDFACVAHRPTGPARLKEHSARKTEWRRVVRALPPVVVAEAGIYAYRPARSTTFFRALRIFPITTRISTDKNLPADAGRKASRPASGNI